MVARTVTQYARAGIAAMHIEDQVQTKRCGHLTGKQVVSREEFLTSEYLTNSLGCRPDFFVSGIRAAVIARDSIPGGSDFVGYFSESPGHLLIVFAYRLLLGGRTQRRFSGWTRL